MGGLLQASEQDGRGDAIEVVDGFGVAQLIDIRGEDRGFNADAACIDACGIGDNDLAFNDVELIDIE